MNSPKKYLATMLLTLVITNGLGLQLAQSQEVQVIKQQERLNPPQLREYEDKAKEFIELWSKQEIVEAREQLTPALQSVLSVEQLKLKWQELQSTTGPLQKIVRTRAVDAVNAVLVFVTIEFKDFTDDIVISFNKDQQIVGVDFPKTDTIEAIALQFVDSLATGDYVNARGNLDAILKTELLPQDIEKRWLSLIEKTGKFQKIEGSEVITGENTADVDLVLVTVEFENVTDRMILLFNQQKRIVGVDFPIIED